jgi:hypothetical protein
VRIWRNVRNCVARFEGPTAMLLRIQVWYLVMLDGGVTDSRRFGGTHRLHLNP